MTCKTCVFKRDRICPGDMPNGCGSWMAVPPRSAGFSLAIVLLSVAGLVVCALLALYHRGA